MKNITPKIGEKAPDFTILTADDKNFTLYSALESNRNVLLVFYRGHW
jgi:peroxiredoxin